MSIPSYLIRAGRVRLAVFGFGDPLIRHCEKFLPDHHLYLFAVGTGVGFGGEVVAFEPHPQRRELRIEKGSDCVCLGADDAACTTSSQGVDLEKTRPSGSLPHTRSSSSESVPGPTEAKRVDSPTHPSPSKGTKGTELSAER